MKWWQAMFLGIETDKYHSVKSDINVANKRNLVVFSLISFVFLVVLGVFISTEQTYNSGSWKYYVCAGLVLLNLIFSLFIKDNKSSFITVNCCFFMIILLEFGILRGAFGEANAASTIFVVLLFAVPLLFTMRPIYTDLITVVMLIVFLISEVNYKTGEILFSDVVNSISFGIISIPVSTFMMRTKFSKFVAEKENADLLDKIQHDSVVDALTGIGNRNAYENNFRKYSVVPKGRDFVYVSIDLNGLKVVNDTMGHAAGDELIKGCAECMQQAFNGYGNLYRVGGDEFVAILFVDDNTYSKLRIEFEDIVDEWCGEYSSGLSVAIGSASISDYPDTTVEGLSKIADKLMYADKGRHYKKQGVDRRGRQEAHTVLCGLYTKILKINLDEDIYQVINVDPSEQVEEKGFSGTISGWFKGFALTGQVHPDDCDEFLKKTNTDYIKSYFQDGKTSLHIFYRRKLGDEYKQVIMEIVPVDTYSELNHELFLYVKNIDR